MKKRFFSTLAALALGLSLSTPVLGTEGTTFVDISPDDWFAPYVEVCVAEGLLSGVGDGRFDPDGILNCDEALVMAARVLLRANGETEFPKGPDAQGFWDWAGWDRGKRFHLGSSIAETQSYAEAWSWDALFYLAQQVGPEPFSEGVVYPASRRAFFRALAIAAQGLDLPTINDISAVPGTRDERILNLYRWGILSGTDGYGTFSGGRHMTRAEAAAALCRLVRPELRLPFAPLAFPYPGYTLTPLMDTESGYQGLGYPVATVGYYDEADKQHVGLLTLDGDTVDFPQGGRIFSSGVDRSWDYAWFYVVDDQWNAKTWLMDAQGNYAPGSGQYQTLYATGDGHFLACDHWSDEELGHAQWYLLSPDGTVEWAFPDVPAGSANDWYGFNEGVCPWKDEDTNLWGYVDAQGQWVIDPIWSGAQPFVDGHCVVRSDAGDPVVFDREWNMVDLPAVHEQYIDLILPRTSPGHEAQGLIYWTDWRMDQGLLAWDGTVYPRPNNSRSIVYYNGYAGVWDETEGGSYYLDANAWRVSEGFEWCGDITPDGRGFVGLEGKVYRIQFEPF